MIPEHETILVFQKCSPGRIPAWCEIIAQLVIKRLHKKREPENLAIASIDVSSVHDYAIVRMNYQFVDLDSVIGVCCIVGGELGIEHFHWTTIFSWFRDVFRGVENRLQ